MNTEWNSQATTATERRRKKGKDSENFYFPFHATMSYKVMRIFVCTEQCQQSRQRQQQRRWQQHQQPHQFICLCVDDGGGSDDENNADDNDVKEANRRNCKHKIIFMLLNFVYTVHAHTFTFRMIFDVCTSASDLDANVTYSKDAADWQSNHVWQRRIDLDWILCEPGRTEAPAPNFHINIFKANGTEIDDGLDRRTQTYTIHIRRWHSIYEAVESWFCRSALDLCTISLRYSALGHGLMRENNKIPTVHWTCSRLMDSFILILKMKMVSDFPGPGPGVSAKN